MDGWIQERVGQSLITLEYFLLSIERLNIFTLPKLSATKIVMWNLHMDNSSKDRYDMILGRCVLTALGLNLKLSDHFIEADYGTFKSLTLPMIDMVTHEWNCSNTGNITPEETFMNAYAEEIHELEKVRTSTKLLRVILDAKYEKADLNKVMKNQCQHLTETHRNKFLTLIQKFEQLFW